MQAMLTEARGRRYRAVYLLKQSHMHRQDVRDHLQTRDRILVECRGREAVQCPGQRWGGQWQ